MSEPIAPNGESWPLGVPPTLGTPLPARMQALTIHRDRYGAPSRSLAVESAPTPRLKPTDAKRVLVSLLASGPNFNTNFAALGLPVPVEPRIPPMCDKIVSWRRIRRGDSRIEPKPDG